ncbi:MAG: ABC transporter permease [Tepidanaerobacteraceae bacterium]|jgi:ABC-2 type transport system permease protein|nr:ABC transporter permease [Tepidanaerobacteraceae bacterium]
MASASSSIKNDEGIEKKAKHYTSANLATIFKKELADQFSSSRFTILFFLIMITGAVSFYAAVQNISGASAGDSEFVLVKIFTRAGNSLPPFTWFLSLLGPLVGLSMGFDAINGEQNRGTMSRLLSQPIYRDDVINGKFLARLAVLAIMTFALGGFVAGMGILLTGVAPSAEEIVRLLLYLALSIVYMAFWLVLSMLFSLLFRQTATSALGGIALWLLFSIFVPLLAGMVADAVFPVSDQSPAITQLYNIELKQGLARLSPATLYSEASVTLLSPDVRTLGPVLAEQASGAIMGFLPLGQSLLLIWPHLTGLIAATLIIFAATYTLFLRQEIRA